MSCLSPVAVAAVPGSFHLGPAALACGYEFHLFLSPGNLVLPAADSRSSLVLGLRARGQRQSALGTAEEASAVTSQSSGDTA